MTTDGLQQRIVTAVDDALEQWTQGIGDRRPQDVIVEAVLDSLLGPPPDGGDTAAWTAVRAIQLMNEAGRRRAEADAVLARIEALADEHPASLDPALVHEALAALNPPSGPAHPQR
ncbi:hypothetical protein [Streptomyces sp. NPDC101249]|uniref:hypothetical protein n=1 Tax=Streptomyces sp. NPDC101249 TaxID=3366140 RepID=UPI0038163F0D